MDFCIKVDPASWQEYMAVPQKGRPLLINAFVGAGAAAQGIAELVISALAEEGVSLTEARRQVWMMDSRGLVTNGRAGLEPFKATYARDEEEVAPDDGARDSLEQLVIEARPTILIGTSATPGTFSEGVVRAMARVNERPIILPLSNPTSKSECTPEDVVRVDFAFRRELAEKVEGNLASFCYQCGACVGDCPATTYGTDFNPREIMLKVLYGLGDELLKEDSILWQCTNCYNCHERCPQEVKPVEVIISMKNMLADRGIYPRTVRVRHVATLLRDMIGYEAIKKSVVRPLEGLKVAIHYGCHLLKPSRVMEVDDPNDPSVLEYLVKALGAEPVRHRNWYLCCGKACQSEDIPANMMHDLLGAVQKEGADILCLICPTCFGQFDFGQVKVAKRFGEDFHTPPIYYLQLLAFAQGVSYDELGLDRQRFKPEILRRYETGRCRPPA